MTLSDKYASKARLLTALKKRYGDLIRFPKGKANCLLLMPYEGVIRGVVFEGSKFKNLWRMRVFAFLPVKRVDFVVLSQIGIVDNRFWNSEKGAWEDGRGFAGLGEQGSDYFESVCGVYEKFYKPWLEARVTPEDLFSCATIPAPSDTYVIPRWPLRRVNEYLLLCIKCEELDAGLDLYERVRDDLDAAPSDENLERSRKYHEPTLEEYNAVLESPATDRAAWVEEREQFTLSSLDLTLEFLLNDR